MKKPEKDSSLDILGRLFENNGLGSIYFASGSEYDYLIENTTPPVRITNQCTSDTLYTQTHNRINVRFLMTEDIGSQLLRTSGPDQIPFLQSNDPYDVLNIVTENKKFLHTIDLYDEFTGFFTDKIGVFFTPSMVTYLKDTDKPFVYLYSIAQLRNDTYDKPVEFMSPRGYRCVVEASKLRRAGKTGYNDSEKRTLRQSEVELDFEEIRRLICHWAPSRLSAIYLMEDSPSAGENMRIMFSGGSRKYPKVLKLTIAGLARMLKADYRWVEAYFDDPQKVYIQNYWNSLPFNEGSTTWEYLYEGGLFILDEEYIPPDLVI